MEIECLYDNLIHITNKMEPTISGINNALVSKLNINKEIKRTLIEIAKKPQL